MILVTGATGFLGMHVLFELAGKGRSVKALYRDRHKISQVRKTWGYYVKDLSVLWDRIAWTEGDILDYYALTESLRGVTEVYHTAGMVSFDDSNRTKLNQVNARGTANMVNACLEQGIAKLCHVSSIATLGESDGTGLIGEQMLWNPNHLASAYAISKLKGEMEVWRGIHEGLKAVIVNPSVIIGPGMWMGSARNLLESLSRGLRFYPSGSSGYVDVRDVASAMVRLTEQDCMNERYIVSAENIPHRDLLSIMADAFGKPRPSWPATPMLMKGAVIAESIRSALTGNPPRVTRRALEIAGERLAYSNQKIRDALAIDFISIEASVKFLVPLFMAEKAGVSR